MKTEKRKQAKRVFNHYSQECNSIIEAGVTDDNVKRLTEMLRRRTLAGRVLKVGLIK